MSTITVDISNNIATITLDRQKTLNALTAEDYELLASSLREIDSRDDVLVTVWQARGNWFCAGTDVKKTPSKSTASLGQGNIRQAYLSSVAHTTTDCGQALYSHRKILVAALNGPVMGIAAAFLGYFDFIYCMPNCWLAVPFTFLGIIAEGGSSVSFVNRMGLAKANEVLLWGKKKSAQELLDCGFVNKIFPLQPTESFHNVILERLSEELSGLDPAALLAVKGLIKEGLNEKNNLDAVNLRESYAQATRFATKVPSERFAKIARKEIKHKL